MRSAPKRIGLFGNFGTGNFGNEASLESMLLFLKGAQPDAELTCVCYNPQQVESEHRVPALRIGLPGRSKLRHLANWVHAIKAVRRFDMLIIPGTGILNDYGIAPYNMPYALFRWCLAAKMCGVRIAFVSVGAGPIHHPMSRWLLKSAASMAQYRSYRDKFSKEFLTGLGLDTKDDLVFPDLAIRLPPPPSPFRDSHDVKGPIIGIGAMFYHGWRGHTRIDDRIYEAYLERVTQFVLWLLDHDYPVRILMGDEMDRQATDDVRKVLAAARPHLQAGALIAEPAHSGHDVMRQMVDTDIVISTRFHHLVFALMLGRLAISTGYGKSHTELMAAAGLTAFCQHSENVKLETLIAQFMELLSNKSHYEASISDAMNSARKRLALQDGVFIAQFVEAPNARGVAANA
jgi:polysaccharide pyruvyl transferase WcaK-like protein